MKSYEINFGVLLMNNRERLRFGFFRMSCLLTFLFCVGCSGSPRTLVNASTMRSNLAFWKTNIVDKKPGDILSSLPLRNVPGVRVYELKWDANCKISVLLARMNRVTADVLDLEPIRSIDNIVSANKLSDLSAKQQMDLRDLWKKRIVSALTTKYFETSSELLSEGLDKDDLTFYYFLCGRHNSAEMGFSDEVKMLCVNSKMQLVSKGVERYGCGYPLYFVDHVGIPVDFLF